MSGTGGGESAEEINLGLSEVYAKCNSICGVVKATGNTAVPNPLKVQ